MAQDQKAPVGSDEIARQPAHEGNEEKKSSAVGRTVWAGNLASFSRAATRPRLSPAAPSDRQPERLELGRDVSAQLCQLAYRAVIRSALGQVLNTWTALIRNGGSACLSRVGACVEGVSLRICTALVGAGEA